MRVTVSPRNPRIPIYRFCLQTAFRARMRIFKSGISGSGHSATLHFRKLPKFSHHEFRLKRLGNFRKWRVASTGLRLACKKHSSCDRMLQTLLQRKSITRQPNVAGHSIGCGLCIESESAGTRCECAVCSSCFVRQYVTENPPKRLVHDMVVLIWG